MDAPVVPCMRAAVATYRYERPVHDESMQRSTILAPRRTVCRYAQASAGLQARHIVVVATEHAAPCSKHLAAGRTARLEEWHGAWL